MTTETMPPEDRDEMILEFLRDHDVALPPTPLFYNMKRDQRVPFSLKTLRRRISSLTERGLLRYIDEGDGYYEITDAGREWLDQRQSD